MTTLASLLARDDARLGPRDRKAWGSLRASVERVTGRHSARSAELERAFERELQTAHAAYDRMMDARRAAKDAREELERARRRTVETRRLLAGRESAYQAAARRAERAEQLWKRIDARRVAAEAAEARRLERFWRRVAG